MKTLLMLTKFYPFGSGEAFVENEMSIVAKEFDRVILIACDIDAGTTKQRKIPSNTEVIRINSSGKANDVSKAAAYFLKPSEELKEEFVYCGNIKQKLFACYFEAKSRRIYESIKKKLNIEALKNDEITLYSYWLFTTARAGLMLKNDLGKAVRISFTRAHRYDLYAERNSLNYLPMRRLLLGGYDKICPCSENGAEYLKNGYPEYSEKIVTALLGTMDYGTNISSSDGVFRIVSCSRTERVKRIDKLIDALELLDDKGYKIEWTHIGGGALDKELKDKAEKSLKKIRYIFKGNMLNTEVMQLYKANPFDLFINVSSSEGLPVSIMEAISFGIPVIATDVGGTAEIVFNGETGYLIPENFTGEQLAGKIEEFVTGAVDYKNLRQHTRAVWEEKFKAVNNYQILCKDIMQIQ
ncbi:MAG: glycosyltransferase [Candidatus Ornithomonoglobus sp.]